MPFFQRFSDPPENTIQKVRSTLGGGRPVFLTGDVEVYDRNGVTLSIWGVDAKVTPLELFLEAVQIEHISKDVVIPKKCSVVYLAFPLMPGERQPFAEDVFRRNGMSDFAYVRNILINKEDPNIPEDFIPFKDFSKTLKDIIRFAVSAPILAPEEVQPSWFLNPKAYDPKEDLHPIHPPGHYPEGGVIPTLSVESFQNIGVLKTDPGPCVVCRGSSGERVHWVTLQVKEIGPTGHICKSCFKDATDQWVSIVNSVE